MYVIQIIVLSVVFKNLIFLLRFYFDANFEPFENPVKEIDTHKVNACKPSCRKL